MLQKLATSADAKDEHRAVAEEGAALLDAAVRLDEFAIARAFGRLAIQAAQKVRDTDLSRVAELRERVQILVSRGVPNYYGWQRFGNRGDTWQVGFDAIYRQD